MSPANNPDVVVVDASVLVSIASKEAATHLAAETAFDEYTKNCSEFFAPNVVVAEVIFALCQNFATGVLTEPQHSNAVKSFLDLMKNISLPTDDMTLVTRAVEIRETFGCSRSSDSIYIALAEDLAKTRTVELFTLDKGMINQAAKNPPTVNVNVL